MVDELIKTQEFSGRKNGFYKKISAIEVDFSQPANSKYQRSSININYNPSSISFNSNEFNPNHLNDNTIETDSMNSPNFILDIFREIRDLKQSLAKLQKKVLKKEKESECKSEQIKYLEKTSERNTKKILKIENVLENHQEKLIKFEGIFKEIEYKKLSDIKEQDILRPCLSERKISKRHTYKDYKFGSAVPSPRIGNRDGLGKLKSLIIKK